MAIDKADTEYGDVPDISALGGDAAEWVNGHRRPRATDPEPKTNPPRQSNYPHRA